MWLPGVHQGAEAMPLLELQTAAGYQNHQGLTAYSGETMTTYEFTQTEVPEREALTGWARFDDFHRKNPHVYQRLVQLAREAVGRGKAKLGIEMLYNVLRWEEFLDTDEADYRLNDYYKAFYARLIMQREEDLDGVFNLRFSIADDPSFGYDDDAEAVA